MAYRLVESNKYLMGEKHNSWMLYVGLYQDYQNYYYVIFDTVDAEQIIMSIVTSPRTIIDLESAILTAITESSRLDNISDFYNELQKSFYGSAFKEVEINK